MLSGLVFALGTAAATGAFPGSSSRSKTQADARTGLSTHAFFANFLVGLALFPISTYPVLWARRSLIISTYPETVNPGTDADEIYRAADPTASDRDSAAACLNTRRPAQCAVAFVLPRFRSRNLRGILPERHCRLAGFGARTGKANSVSDIGVRLHDRSLDPPIWPRRRSHHPCTSLRSASGAEGGRSLLQGRPF